ncbi:MAG: hypothetical protein L0332_12490 [Chloroflexi bacterium]|nr:hypothetical protein [Chloroflexota bacterium]MCI0648404.1 hypothetical protein [Chloroflexota bacterium]MCI0727525.1 hypothetical protein [Chloroflexota bacterium]
MSNEQKQPLDQILDLLLDALQERQRARAAERTAAQTVEAPTQPIRPAPAAQPEAARPIAAPISPTRPEPTRERPKAPTPPLSATEGRRSPTPPAPLPGIHLERLLGRLFLVLVGIVIVVNIPFNRYGTNLARAAPDSAALVIRDGLLLKGSGPDVYVLENNQRRWITTLDAFTWFGYRWEQVHQVEDEFLESFEEGRPIYLLLKCEASPHVYALEDGNKRWIKDIPTFEAQGFLWEDIKFVSCPSLRRMPDGLPIPEDAGRPPQP